jgi:hypothetical protein
MQQIEKPKNIRFVRMTCSMFMGNFVETGWKLKKLKHVAAFACIFVRRDPGRVGGGGGGGAKKNAWKKFAQPLRQREKNHASKQQSANSLGKKFLQR